MIYSAYTLGAFALAAVLYGLGYGSLQPTLNALAVKKCEMQKRGAANATFYISMDLGIGGGSIMLGYLANIIDLPNIYWISSFFVVVGFVLYLILNRQKKNS